MAKMLCRYELENMKESAQFIIDQGLDKTVDLVKTHAVDVFMDKKASEDAQHSLKLYLEAGGDLSEITVYDKAQSEQVSAQQTAVEVDLLTNRRFAEIPIQRSPWCSIVPSM